jgi:crossover junction endodeoxyribonuclease RusA
MADSVEFEVAGPPVPCARPRVVRQPGRGVRTIMAKTTVDYESRVALQALARRPDGWRLDQIYSLRVEVYRPRRAGDWDNFGKSVSDGLNGVLWKDDSQVLYATVSIVEDKMNPRTRVVVQVLDE